MQCVLWLTEFKSVTHVQRRVRTKWNVSPLTSKSIRQASNGFPFCPNTSLYTRDSEEILRNYKYFSSLKTNIINLNVYDKPDEEKATEEFISIIDSSIKEFSARFSQFKELSEMMKFIMYPDVTSLDKLNLSSWKLNNLKCNSD
ncbi:uncharacterized protein TNCV_1350861 [Trichonephila clavipes]|nr:uncharacterized protein TNCV_1350861 [Trichonephila clavipes]